MIAQPIRIVPLHPGPVAAPVTPPHLTYRGGPLLSAVQVVTAFWGAEWLADEAPLLTQINDFFLFILDSPLMDQLAEYSVPGTQIEHGSLAGTAIVTDTQPGSTVTDADVKNLINNGIASAKLPTSTANSLYVVYLPPGVIVEMDGQDSCSAFCGYHDSIAGAIHYAVMPYPDCSGCVGDLHVLDALTSTSSHELCEAVTDPVPGQGWYDDANGEIGDICSWKTKKVGSWTVQMEWSNKQSACI